MKITIQGNPASATQDIQQTLLFYQGRLETELTSLRISLQLLTPLSGERRYRLCLTSQRANGEEIEMEEIQADVRQAAQRLFDRLERRIHRHHTVQRLRASAR